MILVHVAAGKNIKGVAASLYANQRRIIENFVLSSIKENGSGDD